MQSISKEFFMNVKQCPACGAEYYAHVDDCIDCKVPLKFPDEMLDINSVGEEKGDFVPIQEGALAWLKELDRELLKHKIPSQVKLESACKPGSCGTSGLLLVDAGYVDRANDICREYFLKTQPEMADAQDYDLETQCPACGHHVDDDQMECPDCGLAL